MTHELRLFLIALQFLTRLPVPRRVGFEPAWLNQSARYFAAVGIVVGSIGAAVLWVTRLAFAMPVAVGLSMAATLWLTGAFHEDGLADTCDALGGATSRERALEIMKDSRIGSYGAVALIVVLALKAAALASMPLPAAMGGLLLMHVASRSAATVAMAALRYAGDPAQAKAKPLAEAVSSSSAGLSIVWVGLTGGALAAAGSLHSVALVGALVAATITAGIVALWLQRRLGGYTGDGLGAIQQFSELAGLLGVAASVRGGLA